MSFLQTELYQANTSQEQATIQKQISQLDAKIDRMVLDLYGLSEEERGVVGDIKNC